MEQKIEEGKRWGVSWANHFGKQVGVHLVKLNTHKPLTKPGYPQVYALQKREHQKATPSTTRKSSTRRMATGGTGTQRSPGGGKGCEMAAGCSEWLLASKP